MQESWKVYGEIAAYGISQGYALILPEFESLIPKTKVIDVKEKENEIKKFNHYLECTIKKIKNIQKRLDDSIKKLLDIQIYFLKDPMFLEEVEKGIQSGKNLVESIYQASKNIEKFFLSQSNSFNKQRWIDLQDAVYQLLEEILGLSYINFCNKKINTFRKRYPNYILVAKDLSPLVYLKIPKPEGILLLEGSLSGHLILLAANQGIPILVNCFPKEDFLRIQEAFYIGIYTNKGYALIKKNKTIKTQTSIQKQQQIIKDFKINDVLVSLNADDLESIKKHRKNYKISLGLMRTEFLYLRQPKLIFNLKKSEDLYFKIFQLFRKNEVLTLRLIDVDEDKHSLYFYSSLDNMGKRGIEYYKAEQKIILNQIRSIFNAYQRIQNPKWTLRILIPMISSYEDWNFIKEIVLQEMAFLPGQHKQKIQLGIMLEIPSILFILNQLIDVDFFSLGTNDLMALFYGKRRNSLRENDYYNSSFYKLLYLTLSNIKKEISLCGNLATKKEFLKLFYFCGIRNFSVPLGVYSEIYLYFENFKVEKSDFSQFLELLEIPDAVEFKKRLLEFSLNKT
ncbi:MAG: putative PEP-binding protein [Leptonema sp. (in: bacteria)]